MGSKQRPSHVDVQSGSYRGENERVQNTCAAPLSNSWSFA